jgi:hypothetical protein
MMIQTRARRRADSSVTPVRAVCSRPVSSSPTVTSSAESACRSDRWGDAGATERRPAPSIGYARIESDRSGGSPLPSYSPFMMFEALTTPAPPILGALLADQASEKSTERAAAGLGLRRP